MVGPQDTGRTAPTEARDGAPDGPSGEVTLRVDAMAKSFGATQALRDCTFELRPGEVHGLVGENGSGKSTLVKILSGVHAPDRGTIQLSGRQVPPMRNPKVAQENGVVTVFQEVLVAEARSVLDNVWLGYDGLVRDRLPGREKRERAAAVLEELVGGSLDLDVSAERLSLSDRQACCIVRALLREPRVLILDEATSALDIATRERFFGMVKRLTDEGVGVIFITHRMDEIDEISDRLTVMRSGETVATVERGHWTSEQVVHLMTGSDRFTEQTRTSESRSASTRETVLSTRGLQLEPGRRAIDVGIRSGELVGLAGLEGHGQGRFLEALWGKAAAAGTAIRHSDGAEEAIESPTQAAAHDIAYVPRERGQDSIFRWMSIRENFAMPTVRRDVRWGWLSLSASRRRFAEYVKSLGIVLGGPDDSISTLSGGNQQKVIVARWLASEPRVLLLNDPTRGIDINAKRDLYRLLTELADGGMAIVMLSSELDEHIELMDRVLVFREQELVAEVDRGSLTRHNLLSNFFSEQGGDADDAGDSGSS